MTIISICVVRVKKERASDHYFQKCQKFSCFLHFRSRTISYEWVANTAQLYTLSIFDWWLNVAINNCCCLKPVINVSVLNNIAFCICEMSEKLFTLHSIRFTMIYFILSQVCCVPIKRSCEQSKILIDMIGDLFFSFQYKLWWMNTVKYWIQ